MPMAPTPTTEAVSEPAPSKRVRQLNSLVQREVASIIRRELEFPRGVLVTVTKAKVADDAESAKIWVSVLPANKGEKVFTIIEKNIRDIQHLLNKKLVMKFVPKLIFRLDDANDKADHIIHVLDSLDPRE